MSAWFVAALICVAIAVLVFSYFMWTGRSNTNPDDWTPVIYGFGGLLAFAILAAVLALIGVLARFWS
jgi:hypothetical protein